MDDLPLDRVFADQVGADESFPGFLLVDHGKHQLADQKTLAWAYAQTCLKAIDVGLDDLQTPEAAYPALAFVPEYAKESGQAVTPRGNGL